MCIRDSSYEEVAELAYYGAKVLHPKTVTPAIEKKIPVRVLNTFEPEHPGTLILEHTDADSSGTVKAITAIKGLNLITIAGRGMMGVPGVAARTFGAVAKVEANIMMITQSSSEQSICFVVPETSAPDVLKALNCRPDKSGQRCEADLRRRSRDRCPVQSVRCRRRPGAPTKRFRPRACGARH